MVFCHAAWGGRASSGRCWAFCYMPQSWSAGASAARLVCRVGPGSPGVVTSFTGAARFFRPKGSPFARTRRRVGPPLLRAARGGGLAAAPSWTSLCVRLRAGPKCVNSFASWPQDPSLVLRSRDPPGGAGALPVASLACAVCRVTCVSSRGPLGGRQGWETVMCRPGVFRVGSLSILGGRR